MAKVTRAASRSVYVASSPADRMTVWHLRDFLRGLEEAGVPESAAVEYRRSDAGHLTGLSVRHTVSLDPAAVEALGETVFESTSEAPPTP